MSRRANTVACDCFGAHGDLKTCSKCHTAKYCGLQCANTDWNDHCEMCTILADEYAADKRLSAAKKHAELNYVGSRILAEKAAHLPPEAIEKFESWRRSSST